MVSGFDVDQLALRSHQPPVHGEALQRKFDALAPMHARTREQKCLRPVAAILEANIDRVEMVE